MNGKTPSSWLWNIEREREREKKRHTQTHARIKKHDTQTSININIPTHLNAILVHPCPKCCHNQTETRTHTHSPDKHNLTSFMFCQKTASI